MEKDEENKTVQIKKDTWERLMLHKIKGGFESIDQVVRRFMGLK